MAMRIWPKRAGVASLKVPRVNCAYTRSASAASAALKGSSLPQDVLDSIAVGAPTYPKTSIHANVRSVNHLYLLQTRPQALRLLGS
jgi:hypothetical protein